MAACAPPPSCFDISTSLEVGGCVLTAGFYSVAGLKRPGCEVGVDAEGGYRQCPAALAAH